MSIDSQRIQLRPIQVEDAIPVYGWTGDPLVTQPLFWDHHPNINFTVDFLKTIATKHPWFMVICLDGQPVGAITLDQGTGRASMRAKLGYVLARSFWGQGITTMAVKKAIERGFKELDIIRIEAFVDPENSASIKVLEKSGLTREAHLQQYVIHRGRIRDRYLFSTFKN